MSYDPSEIEGLVRQIVTRTLGNPALTKSDDFERRTLIDEEAVRRMPGGSWQKIPKNTLLTPLARQVALERQIHFEQDDDSQKAHEISFQVSNATKTGHDDRTVAIGADHGGYDLKELLKSMLVGVDEGFKVADCGTNSTDSVDYPDYAFAVARMVASGQAWRGIIINGAGIGSCMAANKVPGVRAAMCYDQATAVNSREHNNANVLTLGAGLIGPNLAKQIVHTWLNTEFAGGRHARRVDKIDRIGQRYNKR
jgi:ribose 5-phosphate isomerase B